MLVSSNQRGRYSLHLENSEPNSDNNEARYPTNKEQLMKSLTMKVVFICGQNAFALDFALNLNLKPNQNMTNTKLDDAIKSPNMKNRKSKLKRCAEKLTTN